MKITTKDKRGINATTIDTSICIESGVVINCNITNSDVLVVSDYNNSNMYKHNNIIKGIGFVFDVVVIVDINNEVFYLDYEKGKFNKIESNVFSDIEFIASAGNSTMFMNRDGGKKYYQIILNDNKEFVIKAISRTKFERCISKAIFFNRFLETNDLTLKLSEYKGGL